MLVKLLKYVAAAGGATTVVLAYEGYSLSKKYPWHDGLFPSTTGSLPTGVGKPGHISASVRLPQAARTAPLETYLGAFYSSWTMRLEGWVVRKAKYVTVPPEHVRLSGPDAFAFAGGYFQGIYRDDRTAMVAWNAPGAKPGKPTPGGIQVFTAKIVGDQLEISFGGAEWEPPYGPKLEGAVFEALHHFFSRYLLDQARKRLEAMAKEGK